MMKILEVNVTCGQGSTGVIAVEIATLLSNRGHECYVAYGQGTTDYPNSYKIGSKIENKIHGLYNTRILGEEGSGTYHGTKQFLKWIDSIRPDIIHIHNLHSNFLNYKLFFQYLIEKKIPVVWSFFDCWPFTGKCTHFAENGCRNWEFDKGCKGHCPQLHSSGFVTWFFDKTAKMYNEKKKLFTELYKLNIIVCSNWLKSEVEKSFLKSFPIHMIYNWIDIEKFSEIHDPQIYDMYGVDKTKNIIVSVSAFWDDTTSRCRDAIRLANILPQNYQLVIIGRKKTNLELPDNIIHINYINGTKELSKLYSAATAFVSFSVEDTFGKVIAEAMLCGTPAVVFNSTACPEVVGNAGYAVEPHNVEDMLQEIIKIEKNGRDYYNQRCKELVISRYGYETNVNKYIEIYQSILNNN